VKYHPLVFSVLLVLGGCATAPTPAVHDRLDAVTGETISVLASPLELLTPPEHRGNRPAEFAYLAPFELDRMGARSLYLWILVPDHLPAALPPVIRCDGSAVDLGAPKRDPGGIGLSDAPYAPPYPWSRQWYFDLSDAALACLGQAQVITLETPPAAAQSTTAAQSTAAAESTVFRVESRKGTTGFPALQGFMAYRGH
jgi:hypothetical protein